MKDAINTEKRKIAELLTTEEILDAQKLAQKTRTAATGVWAQLSKRTSLGQGRTFDHALWDAMVFLNKCAQDIGLHSPLIRKKRG